VAIVAECVWKAGNLTSVGKVEGVARSALVSDLTAHGVAATALQHMHTGLSAGFVSLFLGLVFAFLGVFSATKKPKDQSDSTAAQGPAATIAVTTSGAAHLDRTDTFRVSAALIAFVALLYLRISIALFS
jgi:hypothetical protein